MTSAAPLPASPEATQGLSPADAQRLQEIRADLDARRRITNVYTKLQFLLRLIDAQPAAPSNHGSFVTRAMYDAAMVDKAMAFDMCVKRSAERNAAEAERDGARQETARLRAERDGARDALDLFASYGCPVCHGDCASANPPVACCPMQAAHACKSASVEVAAMRAALLNLIERMERNGLGDANPVDRLAIKQARAALRPAEEPR